jgi:hypothetical protein
MIDHRRYSTAGNLDIYRPKSQRTVYSSDSSVSSSPIIYWRSPVYDSTVAKNLASDNDIKKISTYHSNGPLSTYLPLVSSRYSYSPEPSNMYLSSMEKQYYPRASSLAPLSSIVGSRTYTSPYSTYYSPSYSSYPYSRYSNYYNERPYYSDSYSYPYYYTSPYYSSYYSPSSSYNRDYYGYRDLGYYGSAYYPSRYGYSYTV